MAGNLPAPTVKCDARNAEQNDGWSGDYAADVVADYEIEGVG